MNIFRSKDSPEELISKILQTDIFVDNNPVPGKFPSLDEAWDYYNRRERDVEEMRKLAKKLMNQLPYYHTQIRIGDYWVQKTKDTNPNFFIYDKKGMEVFKIYVEESPYALV